MRNRRKPIELGIAASVLLATTLAIVAGANLVQRGSAADTTADATAAKSDPDRAADEKAIRATADDFIKAFNGGDAKAVGALWATDSEYTDESGQSFHGREAIQKEYVDLFKDHRGATMTVEIESVRFLGPTSPSKKASPR